MLNKIRYIVWLILEKLKKDSIYRRKKEIEICMTDDEYYSKYLDEKLKEITDYASDNTKFYSKYKGKTIAEYPVIDKNIIMERILEFKSKEFKKNTHI